MNLSRAASEIARFNDRVILGEEMDEPINIAADCGRLIFESQQRERHRIARRYGYKSYDHLLRKIIERTSEKFAFQYGF